MLWIALVVAALLLAGLVATYLTAFNRLRRQDVAVQEALAGIDVQLTRRADLVPNLVSSVSAYLRHERGVLEELTSARSGVRTAIESGSVAHRAAAGQRLEQVMGTVLAVAEAYPELQASQSFVQLQQELAATEDQVALAREYYNSAVRALNTSVATVPWTFFTGAAGVSRQPFFEAPAGAEVPPIVQF